MSYETIIGLEVHSELKTKTKIFCNCSTKFGEEPNANTCPICLGLPGTLPVMNEEVVNLAVKAGKAVGCRINQLNKMDRKNYFYPDLPKAYQISQFDLPICEEGLIKIETEDGIRDVRINRIHMEEDAGKLVHMEYEPYTLIDYNRVGVPLIEIVTEPDMRSIEEAITFFKTLKDILEYAGISDCKMEQGSIRCDANISMRKVGDDKLNTRVELKNINSFKELQKALEKEQKRQLELYTYGEEHKIVQETRRWDSGKGKTIPMRSKEEAHDYRYFPEPDVIPIIVSDEIIANAEATMPELPEIKKARLMSEYGISKKEVEVLVADKPLVDYFEELIACGCESKLACNWILGDVLRVLKEEKITANEFAITPAKLFKLLALVSESKISTTAAKTVFEEMLKSWKEPEEIVKEKGLSQISSLDTIDPIIEEVIKNNPSVVEQYKEGKTQVQGFLVGQIMKATKGKANPKMVAELLVEKLNSI
ncbi:Asp-tRNA(Asn)/Glu-tRNA(Gln) amidotransferase subunit GatB [Clostridium grantii]|uniref:Aspartyl/glutamyl-tRNA(Asn/Gln) amidotransferase subunit B n=1 Tax=Clostridium grantii DSM 8605 TaxID=1121316 RepID=A0A1M5XQ34_9CLOT|nr:Asp-tRNA(Asn)/Glu-tRNA(Gln) amidotransferase subunit GatB [Clostridium grantii]SHI01772.1 aspartyl/glutamyl-tRNA(Asn/Gln) amidotransferase subunit B [Clostridium grantii DSM 8605]